MNKDKALMERVEEIVAALKCACHDCNPTPCCEYEVLGEAAASLIEAQAVEITRLRVERDSAVNLIDLIDSQWTFAAEKDIGIEAYADWINRAIAEWHGPEKEGGEHDVTQKESRPG